MDTKTFNKQFNVIFKDDPDMQFAIGNKDGKQYLAVFEGELNDEDFDVDNNDLIFYGETTKNSEMNEIRQKAINYLKQK